PSSAHLAYTTLFRSRDTPHRREGGQGRRLGVEAAEAALRGVVRPLRLAATPPARAGTGEGEGLVTDAVLVGEAGDGITQITLNRPERLNAMNHTLVA